MLRIPGVPLVGASRMNHRNLFVWQGSKKTNNRILRLEAMLEVQRHVPLLVLHLWLLGPAKAPQRDTAKKIALTAHLYGVRHRSRKWRRCRRRWAIVARKN